MSWVKWLKGFAQARSGRADYSAAPHTAARPRSSRKGGEAYAREWVKVLESTDADRDPNSTYTWELQTEDPAALARVPATGSSRKPAGGAPTEPFDTFTWELQETDSRDDPWGLKQDHDAVKVKKEDGKNPYDSGVFNASWTGRFDQR